MKYNTHGEHVNQFVEDSNIDREWFDYWDDSDGVTSNDENFIAYGLPPEVRRYTDEECVDAKDGSSFTSTMCI